MSIPSSVLDDGIAARVIRPAQAPVHSPFCGEDLLVLPFQGNVRKEQAMIGIPFYRIH